MLAAGNAALRLPDVHDVGYEDDPAEPCPGCMHTTLEDGVCSVCLAEFCEKCGRVEVTGEAASCERCAPIYEVATMAAVYYRGRSLRRAWEAHCYLDLARYYDAMLIVPEALDLDHDGLTDRETQLLEAWNRYENGAFLAVHTCIAPSEVQS